jgi:hypothetical protein
MFRQLAAFFAMLAFIIFAGIWVVRRMLGMEVSDVSTFFVQCLVIITAYFFVGVFMARLGIALANEFFADRHRREAEQRESARNSYLTLLADEAEAAPNDGDAAGNKDGAVEAAV